MKPINVLALNSGSSSLKFGVYRVDGVGTEELLAASVTGTDIQTALGDIARRLADHGMAAPDAIGHRIVHGGSGLRQHCLIDGAVLAQLQSAVSYAPLHASMALRLIHHSQEYFPGLPQVACFDTAFHAGMPEVASVLPIARELRAQGLRRYGFHGLSCESIVRQLGGQLPERLVIAHLGNGASVTAVRGGKSVDTSMGLTPSGGVIMGTRSGDLDPGVLLFLMRERHYDAARLEALIDHRSGLLGISGVSSDMRRLHNIAGTNADARLAIEMFCYSVRKQIAAMIAVLGGVDLIVFTGGIAEHHPSVRAAICAGLSWIGPCPALVLAAQEDQQIARHAWDLVAGVVTHCDVAAEAD